MASLSELIRNGEGPFLESVIWPPLDETGRPKPFLFACLALLSAIMYKLFYGSKMAELRTSVQKRKKRMRVAQATSIIMSQQAAFKLTKEQADQLKEVDPESPTVYHSVEDLTVKGSVRLPMVIDPASFGVKTFVPAADGAPQPLELDRLLSDAASEGIEAPVKGRRLVSVRFGESERKVDTVEDVEAVFEALTDQDYPATFVLKASPPESHRLFRLVIDPVYQDKIAEQTVFSKSEKRRLQLVEQLLRKRVVEELEEITFKTLRARGMEGAERNGFEDDPDEKTLAAYQSGEKLKEIIKLVEGDRHTYGILHFLPDAISQATLNHAKDVLRRVRQDQGSKYIIIWRLVAPSIPFWFVACVVHGALEVVVAQMGPTPYAAKLIDLVVEKSIQHVDVLMLTMQLLSGWIVVMVWGWFAASLFDGRAQRTFGGSVKFSCLKALLRQDFEFFDKHSTGALNGRLNGDAETLKRHLLGMSRQCITEGTAILANAYLVYKMIPLDMFLLSVLPIPLIIFCQLWLVALMRKWDRQAHFMREDADAGIGQVLGEIKTVRDFAMEDHELNKFDRATDFMVQVEEGHASKRNILGWAMHFLHICGELTTVVVGSYKVMSGEIKPGDLVLAIGMLNGMVGGKIRGMIERVRELTQTAEPAGRICELLQALPTIEPAAADHLITARDLDGAVAILSGLSQDGNVGSTLQLKDSHGETIRQGSKLMSIEMSGGQSMTFMGAGDAVWVSSHAGLVPYCSTPNVNHAIDGRRGLKRYEKIRGKQIKDWVQTADKAFLPMYLHGERVLRLVVTDKLHLQQLLESDPGNVYPLKLTFSRKLVPAKFQGHLVFDHVEFRYPTELRVLALRDVSFSIEAGKQVAIVGHAGCGKSTIFKLIKRLYDPTSGRILLDGQPLWEYDVHHLRRKIAVVAQDNVLFDASLRENVAYGMHPEPTDDEIREALCQASALEFVEAFPDNIFTLVGGRGLTLSGGQRQRVAIARAMVRSPQILILDEATSALDPVNEKIVQRALDALVHTTKATALLIAHRLTTIKDAEKILVLHEGRVVEQGTHDELLQIPVVRHAKRGKQNEGVIKTGYYHAQWNNMMGSKTGDDNESEMPKLSICESKDEEIARLRAETQRLQRELEFERTWSRGDEKRRSSMEVSELRSHTGWHPVRSSSFLIDRMSNPVEGVSEQTSDVSGADPSESDLATIIPPLFFMRSYTCA